MISAGMAVRLCLGRRFLTAIAITIVLVAPSEAASQVVDSNAYDYGGILHATAGRPSFEVVSIRPSAPSSKGGFSGITMHPGRFEIRETSIKDVVEFAYHVPNEMVFSGGPSWIQTEDFNITARPSEAESAVLSKLSSADQLKQLRLMVQSMLEQRFQLKVSFGMKKLPSLALVVAKNGFKCKSAEPYSATDPPPPPPPPMSAGGGQLMHWTAHRMPLSAIVAWIARQPDLDGAIVVDKTGLKGTFDCPDVSWAPENTNLSGPSFFTAIQEQIGLRLHSDKGPVETMHIEQIEHPSSN